MQCAFVCSAKIAKYEMTPEITWGKLVCHCGIGAHLRQDRLWVRLLAVSDIYLMFVEPTITWVPSGFSEYIWLDTNSVEKMLIIMYVKGLVSPNH